MSSQQRQRFTPTEYLALECETEYRNQYVDGEVSEMSGSRHEHCLIEGNIAASLHTQLRKSPGQVYLVNMRVRDRTGSLYTYPDVVVVCAESEVESFQETDTLLNPTLIVEVLSPLTEGFDRGEKFRRYRTIESLKEYLLVAQDKCHIEHYTRQPDNQWLLSERQQLDETVELSSINCTLLLSDVYEKVNLEKQSEEKR